MHLADIVQWIVPAPGVIARGAIEDDGLRSQAAHLLDVVLDEALGVGAQPPTMSGKPQHHSFPARSATSTPAFSSTLRKACGISWTAGENEDTHPTKYKTSARSLLVTSHGRSSRNSAHMARSSFGKRKTLPSSSTASRATSRFLGIMQWPAASSWRMARARSRVLIPTGQYS